MAWIHAVFSYKLDICISSVNSLTSTHRRKRHEYGLDVQVSAFLREEKSGREVSGINKDLDKSILTQARSYFLLILLRIVLHLSISTEVAYLDGYS